MAKTQSSLFEFAQQDRQHRRYGRRFHGGRTSRGKRKLERPLSRKQPLHLVLKASQATGSWSFLSFKNRPWIEALLRQKAAKFGVRIQDFANVGNHLHLKIRFQLRVSFQNFLRSVTGLIARQITGARRGNKLKKSFWDGLAFTRVLKSWKDEIYLRGYFTANRLEGARGPTARRQFLARFNEWLQTLYPA